MSIISEALKKAREARLRGDPAPVRRERGRPARLRNPLRLRPGPAFLLFAGFAVVSGAALYPIFYDRLAPHLFWHASAPGAMPQADTGREAGRGQFSVEEKPMFLGSESASFSLSGIAQFQDGYVAVVNGQILKRGDQIQGAKVTAISSKAVELDYYGERIVLQKTF